ncbi:MAG: peptidase, partial [Frankiales bacterium]|nr:peptidase [Frankiales bacterium]
MRNHGATLRISLAGALVAGLLVAGAAVAAPSAPAGPFTARGSAGQIDVTGVAAGAKVELLNGAGYKVATRTANALGGALFRNVHPTSGYHVWAGGKDSGPITVHSNDPAQWNADIYKQPIPDDGYGYLTTRDGTKLAYNVWPPTKPAGQGTPDITLPSGLPDYAPPYPTLIEYSGYGYANPAGPESGIAVLANLMGFAVVDVNMRGSGCSGGAFDFFEPLQGIDGYDVIETVARQPWVRDHKVGMMGISYGGISQLFTAQYQPPDLAAISPLSVIDTTPTTLYPGGLLNTGFAVAWANERQQNAQAATKAGRGQSWAWDRISAGDTVCKANQALHGEAQDLPATIAANQHYDHT